MLKQAQKGPERIKSQLFITLQITRTDYQYKTKFGHQLKTGLEILTFLDRKGSKTAEDDFKEYHPYLMRGQIISVVRERHDVPDDYIQGINIERANKPASEFQRRNVMRVVCTVYSKDAAKASFKPNALIESNTDFQSFIFYKIGGHLLQMYGVDYASIRFLPHDAVQKRIDSFGGLY